MIGSVKDKIREDVHNKFEAFKSKIDSLHGVIDSNSKLIKDLTETIQEKNVLNNALANEDKVKDGRISLLDGKVSSLENAVRLSQSRET